MAQRKSSADRMRRLRERKRCGSVVIQDLQLSPSGIESLIARGLLNAEADNDSAQVRAAVVQFLNDSLAPPPPAQPLKRAIKAFSSISLGLF